MPEIICLLLCQEQSVSLGMHDSAVTNAPVKACGKSNEPLPIYTTPSQSHAHTQQTPVPESSGETLYVFVTIFLLFTNFTLN